MKVIRITSLLMVLFFVTATICGTIWAETSEESLLVEVVKDIQAGREVAAQDRLKSVLKKDPNNYHALVLSAQLDIKKLKGSDREKRLLNIENKLLRASVVQPHRPEAYLILANLYYSAGDVNTGDRYAMRVLNADPGNFDAHCLLGQRYEDSGNYVAAMWEYINALKSNPYNPYLRDKRYISAAMGGLRPLKIVKNHYSDKTWYWIRRRSPDFIYLWKFRRESTAFADKWPRYKLDDTKFGYCEQAKTYALPYKDMYEAFIKASVKDPAEYEKLRAELDKIRTDALQQIANVNDPVAKAKKLYMYLKGRVLKNYSLDEGILSEQVLKNNKYLCLSGAILYTLIANEAGLPVKGMITPGHAFVSMDSGKRKIQIEMTAEPKFDMEREAGFDIDWWSQFKVLNRVNVYGGLKDNLKKQNIGEVSPKELTAYQFTNTIAYEIGKIAKKHKADREYAETLRRMWGQLDPKEMNKRRQIEHQIRDINYKLIKEVANYYETKGLDLLKRALAIAPGSELFQSRLELAYLTIAKSDMTLYANKWQEVYDKERDLREELARLEDNKRREEEQYGKDTVLAKKLGGQIEEKLKELSKKPKQIWDENKKILLKAISRLENAVEALPCSRKLQAHLEAVYFEAAKLAGIMQDKELSAKIISAGLSRLPNSNFAKYYRFQRFGA